MEADELTAVRRRMPLGTRVRGTISDFPAGVGRAGACVDLGDPVRGWVDMLWLPREPEKWPPVGRAGFFEVIQHRGSEVRLCPLDAGMRGQLAREQRWSGPEWAAISRRWPVGSVLEATVVDVFPGNREYTVRFADYGERVEYEGPPPEPGSVVRLVVERQSEWTQYLTLRPVDGDGVT